MVTIWFNRPTSTSNKISITLPYTQRCRPKRYTFEIINKLEIEEQYKST